MLAFLLLSSLFSIGLSVGAHESSIKAVLAVIWPDLDTNHSGNLELSEVTETVFKSFDGNDDHEVTEAEFLIGWNSFFGEQESAGRSVYSQIDLNDDGFWTNTDLIDSYKIMDAGGDGLVSKAEYIDFGVKVLMKANFMVTGGVIG